MKIEIIRVISNELIQIKIWSLSILHFDITGSLPTKPTLYKALGLSYFLTDNLTRSKTCSPRRGLLDNLPQAQSLKDSLITTQTNFL